MQRIVVTTATLVLAALAHAQEPEPAPMMLPSVAHPARQEMHDLRLGSPHVRDAVRTLCRELEWHDDLEDAAAAAAAEGKPILWIQALGDLKGYA